MADVFISYASEDRDRAGVLAAALAERGWTVWWDRKIVPGSSFDMVIEREISSARCVIVLWSRRSVASEWVRNEASVAKRREVLVPVGLEPVEQPLEFQRRQMVDLTDWDGNRSDDRFVSLCQAIEPLVGKPDDVPPRTDHAIAARGLTPSWVPAAVAAGLVVIAVGVGLALWTKKDTPPPFPTPPWETVTSGGQNVPNPAQSDPRFGNLPAVPSPSQSTPAVPDVTQAPSVGKQFPASPAPGSLPPLTLTASNVATPAGPDRWRWTVFLKGSEEMLNAVECVEYTLHPTFGNRFQTVCQRGDSNQAFALTETGWGTFQVGIRVRARDGRQQELKHQLQFR